MMLVVDGSQKTISLNLVSNSKLCRESSSFMQSFIQDRFNQKIKSFFRWKKIDFFTSAVSLCRWYRRCDRRWMLMRLLPRSGLLDQTIVGRVSGSTVAHRVARRMRRGRRRGYPMASATAPVWRGRRRSVRRRRRRVRSTTRCRS